MDHLHKGSFLAKPSATAKHNSHVTITTVLALATLCAMTINRNDAISVALPKEAKASTNVSLSPALSCEPSPM